MMREIPHSFPGCQRRTLSVNKVRFSSRVPNDARGLLKSCEIPDAFSRAPNDACERFFSPGLQRRFFFVRLGPRRLSKRQRYLLHRDATLKGHVPCLKACAALPTAFRGRAGAHVTHELSRGAFPSRATQRATRPGAGSACTRDRRHWAPVTGGASGMRKPRAACSAGTPGPTRRRAAHGRVDVPTGSPGARTRQAGQGSPGRPPPKGRSAVR